MNILFAYFDENIERKDVFKPTMWNESLP